MEFSLSPYVFQIGGYGLRYYSLMYLVGLGITYWWLTRVAKYDKEQIADLCLYGFLALVLGGRLGYVLFYQPQWIWTDPLQVVKIWEGGMSIHGGIIAVGVWVWYFVKKHRWDFWKLGDSIVVPGMFGVGLARIGNFMNGELWGRLTDVPWCMYFPGVEGCRHPSMLYESVTYMLLSLVMAWVYQRSKRPGVVTALFFIFMGGARTVIEIFYREPTWVYAGVTAGTWLSVPLFLFGLGLLFFFRNRYSE
ncbi:MAG: prolipoprotein diacylglyceryl transferase [Candidatus Altimarinota bacterium]